MEMPSEQGHTQLPPDSINIDQLLNQFLHKLKDEQFSIGTDSFIQSTAILKWFVEEKRGVSFALLQLYLGPVLCKNDKEQADFSRLFNTYFLPEIIKIEEVRLNKIKQKRRKWFLILGAALVLLTASHFVYRYCITPPVLIINYKKLIEEPYFHRSDSITLNAGKVFSKKSDTGRFTITYKFSDGTIKNGAAVVHSFNKYGVDSFWVNFKSAEYGIDTNVLYSDINVGPLRGQLIIPETELAIAGETSNYSTEADTISVKRFYWLIDSVRQEKAERKLAHIFSKPGNYTIELRYDTDSDSFLRRFPERFVKASYLQKVVPATVQLNIEHEVLPPINENNINKAWLFSFIAIMIAFILAGIRQLNRKPIITPYDCIDENFTGDKPPYTIPFLSKEQNINPGYALQRLSNDLKKRMESQAFSISIDKTIKESINNRGFVSPQYLQKQINREYLFLIDYAYVNSQQVKLFTYLVKYFITRSVQIDFYFYHQQPDKFFKYEEGNRISPIQIKDMHYNATLIFITEGTILTDWQQPFVKNEIVNIFSFWQSRLLVTPVPAQDWSGNEKVLSQFFRLLPADIEGLLELVRLIDEDGNQSAIQNKFSTYTAKHEDFNNINSLETYLNDEELFQWLCAAAILPKIYWEVLLEAGKVIVKDVSKINYTTLLKLVRIKWVHQGVIPPSLRLELLKKLTGNNELAARSALLGMLDEAPVNEDSFSFEEKQVIRYSSSFILFASGKMPYVTDKKIQDGENKFICLYKNERLLDNPFKIYIEKKDKGDKWDTPIQTDAKDGGIQEYIREKELGLKNELRVKRQKQLGIASTYLVIAITILFLLINLFVNKNNIANESQNLFNNLIDTSHLQDSRIMARVLSWNCINDLLHSSRDSIIELELYNNGQKLYTKKLSVGDTSILQLNEKQIQLTNSNSSSSNGPKFSLNINGQKYETGVRLQPGIINISLAGNCDTDSSSIFIDYYPGYGDDTNKIKNILQEVTNRVSTFEDNAKVQFANSLTYESNIDGDYIHRICKSLLNAGAPLKRIVEIGINGSRDQRGNRRKRIIVNAEESLADLPVITADSIDCRFKNMNCPPPVNKSSVRVFYNNVESRNKIEQLRRCMNSIGFIDAVPQRSNNISDTNEIRYYRDSFADSIRDLRACIQKSFPDKSFALQKMPRPFASNAAAEIYIADVPDKPEVTIEISNESLRNDAEAFSKNLSANGYTVTSIKINTRNYNSVIEYNNSDISQQAQEIQNIYRRYFPNLSIETKYTPTRALQKSIVIWIQQYIPASPVYKIQNVKFPNQVNKKDKFQISFEVNVSNLPASVSQNNIAVINGTVCIFSQQSFCTNFKIDKSNGAQAVGLQIDISNINVGRHSARMRVNEIGIDTLLGYFNIIEDAPATPCDTIVSYIGGTSKKTFINSPLYKEYGIELSLDRNNSDTSGVFTITYNRCKDNKTSTIKTGGRTSFTFCDGVQLHLWLQKWENRTGNVRNKEAVFQAIVCNSNLKPAPKK